MSPSEDPSKFWGTVAAAVGALLTVAVSFGLPITEEQTNAILGFVVTAGPLVVAYLISRKAYKPETVRAEVAKAVAQVVKDTNQPKSPLGVPGIVRQPAPPAVTDSPTFSP